MPSSPSAAGAGGGSPDLAGLGVLTREISPELVDEVIEAAGCREKRRRLLPARVAVYFVLGLCLFSGADSLAPPGYRSVMRSLANAARQLRDWQLPTRQALVKARQRLGSKPFELLFDKVRGPLADAGTAGAYAFGLRLVAWDGTGIDMAGTAANAAAFGRLGEVSACPQVRLLALTECGTHAVIDAAFDSYARVSEQELARRLLHALRAGMLLLADRNFAGWELWGLVTGTGADMCWRIKKNLLFPPVKHLPDGSWLSVMPTPAEAHRRAAARYRGRAAAPRPAGHLVRIIEYTITVTTARGTRTERFRLATTLLDHRHAPARQLAATYQQRWESENSYGEIKTRLRGAGFILRSRTPDLASQEILAFLITYQALRSLAADAARHAGTGPGRISFTWTIRIARDHAAGAGPASPAQARQQAITDILLDLLPARRNRQSDRTRRPPRNRYPVRKTSQTPPTRPVTYTITISTTPAQPAQAP